MVAKIVSGKSMRGALSYNENKVAAGEASCIAAFNFGKQPKELSFYEKLSRFGNITRWNQKVRTNTLHISLNFDPSEKLSAETLELIASAYMQRIGFGEQPFLVYQHFDAAHPHIHILSTNVKGNGKAISLHNLGRLRSEPARKSIEKEFKLVEASNKSRKGKATELTASTYGKAETKRTIANTVGFVTQSYRYTSLAELNAVLQQYNIAANQGSEGSIMQKKGGLIYSFIDEKGQLKGVPIKASALHFKPTLKFLQKQFLLNDVLRRKERTALTDKINAALLNKPTIAEFKRRLQNERITLVLRRAKDNRIFGMTFIDNATKVVFNGSDLSKSLGAKNILEKLDQRFTEQPQQKRSGDDQSHSRKFEDESRSTSNEILTILSEVIAPEESFSMDYSHLHRKTKRKKRRRRN